jgi:WD40 repeat protein
MTPYSVRRPDGYCLNELARAFARNLPIIPVMVSTVEPPLSICRLQWLDMRNCYPAEQHEERYRKQFERLVEALQGKHVPFEGVQQRLLNYLQPFLYDDMSRHLSRFTGREWLMAEVKAWLNSSHRVLWITGEAGVGKSAAAAWLCDKLPDVSAYHFCHFGNTDRMDARRALFSLAYQLSTQLPVYQDRLNASPLDKTVVETNVRSVFDRLFVNLLTDAVPLSDKPCAMLIDALDEATLNGENQLASLIGGEFDRLPSWLRVIITSRPHEQEINSELQALDPWKLDAGREENLKDIRTYLYRELRPFTGNGEPSDEVVDKIVDKSEGLFLYVTLVREELERSRLSLARSEDFPQGLGAVYLQWFRRYFPDIAIYQSDCRPALEAICAAREPLPRNYLKEVMGWSDYQMDSLAERLGSLVPFVGEDERVRPVHRSLRDWLTDRKRSGAFRVNIPAGEQRLAEFAWQQYKSGVGSMSRYSVVHGPSHLRQAHRENDIARLLLDFEWLRAKLVTTDVLQLTADYRDFRNAPLSRLIGEALQLSAHVLEDDPRQLAQHMIARLDRVESGPIQDLLAQARRLQVGRSWLEPILSSLPHAGEPLERTITSLERTTKGPERISSLAITPDAGFVLAGGPSHLTLWDITTGQATKRIMIDSALATTITPDGSHAAAAGRGGFVTWDLVSDKWHTVERPGHFAKIAITPDGKRVITCSLNGELQVWDFGKRRQLRSWHVDGDKVNAMALSPDGLLIVTAGADFNLEVWEINTGAKVRTCTGHREVVNAVSVSSDGQRIISGSLDGVLNVWNLQNGQRLCSLNLRSDDTGYGLIAVGLTSDGMRAIAASDNGTATVRDVNSDMPLLTWRWRLTTVEEEDFCGVSEIALTLDGKRAVSVSHQGDLQCGTYRKSNSCMLYKATMQKSLRFFLFVTRASLFQWPTMIKPLFFGIWMLNRAFTVSNSPGANILSTKTTIWNKSLSRQTDEWWLPTALGHSKYGNSRLGKDYVFSTSSRNAA